MSLKLSRIEMAALADHSEENPKLSEEEVTKNLFKQELIDGTGALTSTGIEIGEKLAERLEDLRAGVPWDTRKPRTKKEIMEALISEHPDDEWKYGTYQKKPFCTTGGLLLFAKHVKEMKATKVAKGTGPLIMQRLSGEASKKMTEVFPLVWTVKRYEYPDYVWLCDEEGSTAVLVNAYYLDYLKSRFKSVRFFTEYGSLEKNILTGRVTNHGVTDLNVVCMLASVNRSGFPCPVE